MLPDCSLRYTQNYRNQNHSTDTKTNTMLNGIRIENPEINPYTYSQLIYKKKEARLLNGETTGLSVSGAGKPEQLHGKE